MTTALILLAIVLGLTLFWLDSARARELATAVARSLCERRGLQFLDDTVVLRRIGLRWGNDGIRFRRLFDFDFSAGDGCRHSGYLILLGPTVEQYGLDLPDGKATIGQPPAGDDTPAAGDGSKVVPFRRPGKK